MRSRLGRVSACWWRSNGNTAWLCVRLDGIDAGELLSVRNTKTASIRPAQICGTRFSELERGVSNLPLVKRLLEGRPYGGGQLGSSIWPLLGRRDSGERRNSRDSGLRD